jgi:hypothetical protein
MTGIRQGVPYVLKGLAGAAGGWRRNWKTTLQGRRLPLSPVDAHVSKKQGSSRIAERIVLARADFRGATFTAPIDSDGAFFFLTRIEGLDLSKSAGLSQWQLNMAC